MRVIITGGTGLIGSSLAESLAANDHEVILLSRSPERYRSPHPRIRAVAWDGRSATGWAPLVEDTDVIVNLAGENLAGGRWTDSRKRLILESRRLAGQAVVEAVHAAREKPNVVIQSSAVGYYGNSTGEIQREDSPPGTGFLSRVCVAWEDSTQGIESLGVRRVIIRTGPVLATKGEILKRMALPYRFFVGGPVGGGQQWFSWIHIADEIRAIRHLIDDSSASGPYTLAAPNPVTNRQFGQALGRALRRPSWFPVPAFVVRLIFGEMAETVLEGQRALPARLQSTGFAFRYPTADDALTDLLR